MLTAGENFLVPEEQGVPLSTTKITLMWIPHSNNAKHANVITHQETGKRRGKEFDQSL